MNDADFFSSELNALRDGGNYPEVFNLERCRSTFPPAKCHYRRSGAGDVMIWSTNDVLGWGRHPAVLVAMHEASDRAGAAVSVKHLDALWSQCELARNPMVAQQ